MKPMKRTSRGNESPTTNRLKRTVAGAHVSVSSGMAPGFALLCASLLWTCACVLPFLAGIQPLEAGTTAPAFTLPGLTGESVSLADFEGQPILLNFWTTTCSPCLKELPVLATLEREFAAEGLVVVTVCMGSSPEEARQALQKANADVRTLVDEDAVTATPYQIGGTPTTYLVDDGGVIVMSNAGYGDGTESILRDEIERLLEE